MGMIRFDLIFGLLMITAAICLLFHFRFDRISCTKFKGKIKLYITVGSLAAMGVIMFVISIIRSV